MGSPELFTYGGNYIDTILHHYGKELPAKSLLGKEFTKRALISADINTEWKTLRRYISQRPKEDKKAQIRELTTNTMLIDLFPNLKIMADICLSIPIGTASIERSFSQMKMIKTRLRHRLKESSLSLLMKIAIESPEKLSDEDLNEIIEIWNRKPRRIIV